MGALIAGGRAAFRSVRATLAANLCNQLVVALSQLLLIPILIALWGVPDYGAWVLLTAVPAALAVSDLGFTSSAKSDMSLRVRRGDSAGARVTASSVAALLLVLLAAVVVFGGIAALAVDWSAPFALPLPGEAARTVIVAGLVQLSAAQLALLGFGILRAAGRPALEALLSAGFRGLDALVVVGAAALGFGLTGAAIAWAAVRVLETLGLALYLAVRHPDLMPTPRRVDFHRLRALLPASLGYVLLPLGHALSVQGVLVVLGSIAGAPALVLFSATRTVTRLGVAGANTLNSAVTPHYTYALGSGDEARVASLAGFHAAVLAAGTAVYLAIMLMAADGLVALLSHGLHAGLPLLALLAGAAALEMLWSYAPAIGAADNRLGRLPLVYVGLSALALIALALHEPGDSVPFAAMLVAGVHALMLAAGLLHLRASVLPVRRRSGASSP